MKNKIFTLIKIATSLIFISLLVWSMRGNWGEIVNILKGIDIFMLILGAVFVVLAVLVIALRLAYLFKANDFRLNYRDVASLTFIGFFFNNFLPTAMGGDIVKAYYAAKKTKNKLTCFATVAMDRVLGIFTLFVLGGTAALIVTRTEPSNKSLLWAIFAILAAMTGFFMILWNKKIAGFLFFPILAKIKKWSFFKNIRLEERLRSTYETFNNLRHKKPLMAKIFIISCVAQFISFLAIYFWSKGIGSPVPMWIILVTMPLVSVSALVPSINGLGVREAAMVLFLGPYVGKENAFALASLWFLMLCVLSVIGGLNYAFNTQFRIREAKL